MKENAERMVQVRLSNKHKWKIDDRKQDMRAYTRGRYVCRFRRWNEGKDMNNRSIMGAENEGSANIAQVNMVQVRTMHKGNT